ncbi:hypothetical protein EVJ50_01270 [Synechococcus sp. RSCCF101]|uniref:hypothetical protein n=1 Tax=Synechococcus sp. RSCCF101 TaxID=2511069 RepID=UPI001247B24E|nr:hypothetical protein [Synechococcus sp. RSCCF101]QEY31087.1 hypothetical protein EVJ50_01270 [Synechococcus sp. RSCCF101]
MSLLRQIMQQLGERVRSGTAGGSADTAADSAGAQPAGADPAQLKACSDGMLLYEWEWLERRLEQPGLDPEHRADLRRWLSLLRDELQARSLSPIRPPGPLQEACHAWQVNDPEIRRLWSFH